MSGLTLSCMVALAAVIIVSAVTPTSGRTRANVRYVGMKPAMTSVTPNSTAAETTSRCRGVPRRAASSAPASDPTAMAEPSRPNSPAPLWNTFVAIRAVVSWKLRPKVPAKNTIAGSSSGRADEHVPHAVADHAGLARRPLGVDRSAVRIRFSDQITAR